MGNSACEPFPKSARADPRHYKGVVEHCQCQRCFSREKTEADVTLPPCHVNTNPKDQDIKWYWHNNCFNQEKEGVAKCLSPAMHRSEEGRRKRAIFLIGDSHAAHLLAGLEAATFGRYILVHSTAQCVMGLDLPNFVGYQRYTTHVKRLCKRYYQNLWPMLELALKPDDVVIVSMVNSKIESGKVLMGQVHAYKSLANFTAAKQASLVVVGDTGFVMMECTPKEIKMKAAAGPFANAAEKCTEPARHGGDSTFYYTDPDARYMRVAKQFKNAYFVPLKPHICYDKPQKKGWVRNPDNRWDGWYCSPFIPGTTILWSFDNNHLSEQASLSLWPIWCRLLHHEIKPFSEIEQ